MVKVILDAMGGDHAPDANFDGVAQALSQGHVQAEELLLVGQADRLKPALEARGLQHLQIVDAPDELSGDETPVEAMRKKPRSSVGVAMQLITEGQGDAFVSAGSTGVVVASATVGLGMLEGIRRPGIATVISGDKGPFMLVDVGANPQPKPRHLLQYGIMGSAYFRDTFGEDRPRVGLMNIGSENKKGNPLILEAREMLEASGLNFVGNVEGGDLFKGNCDIVVCDGFTGNVLLKAGEGVADYVLRATAATMQSAGIPGEQIMKVVKRVQGQVDYSHYGGALLLGVKGIVTICHGRSDGAAIGNAIRFAHQAVGARVNEHIVDMARSIEGAKE